MWTLSNIISFVRILLVFPLGYYIWTDQLIPFIIVCLIGSLSDILDGHLARKLNQVTEFGKIIDPLADKIFVGVAAFIMAILNIIPLWFFIVIITRDVLILIGGIYAQRKLKYVLPSNYMGKIAVIILSLTIMGMFSKVSIAYDYGMYISLLFLIISLIQYFFRMMKELNKA